MAYLLCAVNIKGLKLRGNGATFFFVIFLVSPIVGRERTKMPGWHFFALRNVIPNHRKSTTYYSKMYLFVFMDAVLTS